MALTSLQTITWLVVLSKAYRATPVVPPVPGTSLQPKPRRKRMATKPRKIRAVIASPV
jgi:hypothetical protein